MDLLAGLGLTLIISRSKLFAPLRDWLGLGLLFCPQCVGFWCGGLWGLVSGGNYLEIMQLALSVSCLGYGVGKFWPEKSYRVGPEIPNRLVSKR